MSRDSLHIMILSEVYQLNVQGKSPTRSMASKSCPLTLNIGLATSGVDNTSTTSNGAELGMRCRALVVGESLDALLLSCGDRGHGEDGEDGVDVELHLEKESWSRF
jgi:hypothetical protein